jgi:transcriptional regulator with XRE-family HTH domain
MIKLKKVLKEKGVTQAKLSNILKKSPITISSWATGKSTPSIEVLVKICQILDCEINELIEVKKKKHDRAKK